MDATQDFINFALSRPEYFHIAKSRIFLRLLMFISNGKKLPSDVYKEFSQIEAADIDQMIGLLAKVGLVEVGESNGAVIYSGTQDAKIFLEKVKKAKKELFL